MENFIEYRKRTGYVNVWYCIVLYCTVEYTIATVKPRRFAVFVFGILLFFCF